MSGEKTHRGVGWARSVFAAAAMAVTASLGLHQGYCAETPREATVSEPVEQIENPLDFKLKNLQGEVVDGASLAGKVVLIDFWATWCAPCLKAFPTLNKLQHDLGDRGFQVISIALNSGTVQDVAKVVKQRRVEVSVVMGDKEIEEKFDVIGYPTYVLVNPQGKVHAIYVGEVGNLYERIAAEVEALKKKGEDQSS